MKKVIPVLIAIVLIIVVGAIGFGAKLVEKYSYSKERADLEEYFDVQGSDDVPIILQDERIEEHAKRWDGVCYFDLATVHKYFNDRFYEDKKEDLLIYTLPDAVISTPIGTSSIPAYGMAPHSARRNIRIFPTSCMGSHTICRYIRSGMSGRWRLSRKTRRCAIRAALRAIS